MTGRDNAVLSSEIEGASGWPDPQSVVAAGPLRINVEAFNKKREKEIAEASKKLVSLAIALKSELDRAPDQALSADAVAKAREIEKLAHKVKEAMRSDPNGP